jgi:hypothetical protein
LQFGSVSTEEARVFVLLDDFQELGYGAHCVSGFIGEPSAVRPLPVNAPMIRGPNVCSFGRRVFNHFLLVEAMRHDLIDLDTLTLHSIPEIESWANMWRWPILEQIVVHFSLEACEFEFCECHGWCLILATRSDAVCVTPNVRANRPDAAGWLGPGWENVPRTPGRAKTARRSGSGGSARC